MVCNGCIFTVELIQVGERSVAVCGIEGPNFSGRSSYLNKFGDAETTKSSNEGNWRNSFVGADVHNYISGLIPTTQGELELHGLCVSERRETVCHLLNAITDWDGLLSRNPLTLSGGQQVILALATALLSARDLMAIDCALEQLSPEARKEVLRILSRSDETGVRTVLADNRLSEFRSLVSVVESVPQQFRHFDDPLPPVLRGTPFAYSAKACLINLDNIRFKYPKGPQVFTGLSYQFEPSRIYFLKGPNGVGKTTLCKILCGLLRQNGGQIVNESGAELDPWKEPGKIATYHFQNPDIQLFSTSVFAEIGGGRRDIALSFGLESFLDSHPHDLPFVLRKRVALAATLSRERPWLILDEPILGQDDSTAIAFARVLGELISTGIGVIIATHSQWFRSLFSDAVTLHLENSMLRDESS